MKVKDALLYCRQLLFEQRLEAAWLGAERLAIARVMQRWQDFPAQQPGDASIDAERQRWKEEVDHERRNGLERSRRDARLLERAQARLDAAEGVVMQLRADNDMLREELATTRQREELEGELEQLRVERSQRAAAGARAAIQEAELRKRLEAEERRLADSSSQLVALEGMAEEDEGAMQVQQAAETADAHEACEHAISMLRTARAVGGGGIVGRVGWRVLRAHARAMHVSRRHEAQVAEHGERLEMLHALRESREALDWRVTQTKAQLIVMRSAAESTQATAAALHGELDFGLNPEDLTYAAGAGSAPGSITSSRLRASPQVHPARSTSGPGSRGSLHSSVAALSPGLGLPLRF